ncbi:unnamed protein product, partial [Cuscuta epithymum]
MDSRYSQAPRQNQQYGRDTGKNLNLLPENGPSTGQVLAIVALIPIGTIFLGLAGISFLISMIGLGLSLPVYLLFSPVLVPATMVIGLAVTGVLTSGAFGITGLSSLWRLINYFSQGRSSIMPAEKMDYAKKVMQNAMVQVGQKTQDVGQTIQNK